MEKQRINIGIAGFGSMGKTHAYCIANLPFFYQDLPFSAAVKGVVTQTQAHSQMICSQYHFPAAYASVDEMIADPDIQVIDVCLPNNLHFDTVIKALRSGKNVLCEKPMGITLDEARAMTSLAKEKNLSCGMVFNNRFLPAVMKAKDMIDHGQLGELLSFRFVYHHNSCIDPNRTKGWKQDKSVCGGGTLYDLGSHVIDLSNYLCGKIDRVNGLGQIAFPTHLTKDGSLWQTNADEAFYITAKTKNGAVGTIECSKISVGANDDLSFAVYGTKGALRFSLMEPEWLWYYDAGKSNPPRGDSGYTKLECGGRYAAPGGTFPSPKAPLGWLRGHVHSYYSFLNALYTKTAFYPSFEDGLYVQAVMTAAEASAGSGLWESVVL